MHCMSWSFDLFGQPNLLPVQRRLHGTRVYSLCGKYVQSTHRLRRMHRLRRGQVLYNDGGNRRSVLLGLSWSKADDMSALFQLHLRQMHVRCRLLGAGRRRLLGVCDGDVQASPWHCRMHRLLRRHVFEYDGCDSAGHMH